MDAADVIAHYVLDTSTSLSAGSDQPLTAESDGNTTFYLYGLGAIAEQTDAWSYSLPDGTNTPRQLTDTQGDITLSARYTPWGDSLELHGTGNFTFGYLGGVLDATTGLLYVGNGQYYDPATGRFLTRDAKPNSSNPYVPWDPTGAIVGPLGMVALFFSKKKKGSKAGTLLVVLLVVATVSMTLAACGGSDNNGRQQNPMGNTNPNSNQTPVYTGPGNGGGGTSGTATSPSNPLAVPCPMPLENVPIPTQTPASTQTPIITLTPTPILEPWRQDSRYNSNSRSIEGWNGTRESRTQDVWNWICISGGWWGSGRCPTERELAPWLLFHEGGVLSDNNLIRMAKGIEYRFGRWGFNVTQLAGFTAFFNPVGGIGDTTFGELDWASLMTPPDSKYIQIIDELYSRPVPSKGYIDDDGYYMYWFSKTDMDNAKVTESMLPEGQLFSTSDPNGLPFYFTGNNYIFLCATRALHCKR